MELAMNESKNIDNSDELEFAVFCVENVAQALNIKPQKLYDILTEESNILNGYIIPEYNILHTQSREYIVEDIITVMKETGASV